jgi:hypothetical protein
LRSCRGVPAENFRGSRPGSNLSAMWAKQIDSRIDLILAATPAPSALPPIESRRLPPLQNQPRCTNASVERFPRRLSLLSSTTRSEFVPLDLQCRRRSVASDDLARHNELQLYTPAQQDRPVDGYIDSLSGLERPFGGEAQPRAAQVDGAASARLRRPTVA